MLHGVTPVFYGLEKEWGSLVKFYFEEEKHGEI
jgi:hypothetical protein